MLAARLLWCTSPMDTVRLVDALRSRLPHLEGVWLFGSEAAGRAGPDSDLDLAILGTAPLDAVALWGLAQDLARQVDRDVDLVDIARVTSVLQHRIVTRGRLLWTRGDAARLYETFVLNEYTRLIERTQAMAREHVERRIARA
jgi:predicted nucleotidyltransferase